MRILVDNEYEPCTEKFSECRKSVRHDFFLVKCHVEIAFTVKELSYLDFKKRDIRYSCVPSYVEVPTMGNKFNKF